MKVWIDGAVVDESEARIPVNDHGFLYGDGVFEGLRSYAGRIFRLDDHLRRLSSGARALALDLPGGTAALRRIVLETARAFGEPDMYLRLVVSRGVGPLGVDPTTCAEPRVVCLADGIQLYPDEKLERGIALLTSSLRRPSPDVLDPRIKSLNYLNSALAKLEARQSGADEALLLNAAGRVAETAVTNVFAVRSGVLQTPPVSEGALEGITRQTVLELATERGIPARELPLTRFDLLDAEEVFLTGTGARIVGVASLDGRRIGVGRGPLTKMFGDAYDERVRSEGTPF